MLTKSELNRAISSWKRQKIKIIAVAGPRKAGKDVAVEYIVRNYKSVKHLRIADAPMLIAKILGLEADRRVYHALFGVNKLLYPLLGESAYMRRVAHMLDTEKPKIALVEAIRTKEEYRAFVEKRKGILICVTADPKVRYARALKDAAHKTQKRDEGKMTFNEFMGDRKRGTGEHSPIEREVNWIISKAPFVITNNYDDKEPVHKKLKEILSSLGLKRKSR
ncbi:MAG: hypothetical protein Q7R91_02665 [bacterium]|nr:hypothetical protein [bacterium]